MPELTVGSCNLHWGRGPRPDYEPYDVVAAAGAIDADVLALQESWSPGDGPAQHDRIADELGYEVVAAEPVALGTEVPFPRPVARARDPRAEAAGATGTLVVAVLSRVPAAAVTTTPLRHLRLDAASRSLLRVDLDVGGLGLSVVATHMAHLHMGSVLHAPAVRRVLRPLTDRPAVFVGDLNMWRWCTPAYVPRGWRGHGRGRTYPAPAPWARIDHLLATASVEVRRAEVLPDVGSDHRPIRARLRVP